MKFESHHQLGAFHGGLTHEGHGVLTAGIPADRVVHQDVQPALFRLDTLEQRGNGRIVSDIVWDRYRFTTPFVDLVGDFFNRAPPSDGAGRPSVSSDDVHRCAALSENLSDTPADASAGPRDNSDSPRESWRLPYILHPSPPEPAAGHGPEGVSRMGATPNPKGGGPSGVSGPRSSISA